MWQSDWGMGRCVFKTLQKGKGHFETIRSLNVVFTAFKLEPAGVSPSTFLFWFGILFMK